MKQLTPSSIKKPLLVAAHRVAHYRIFIFFLVASALYGFIIWRIDVLAVSAPSDESVQTAEKTESIPTIKSSVIEKMNSLKDNSVNVQTLFEQSRSNPFNE